MWLVLVEVVVKLLGSSSTLVLGKRIKNLYGGSREIPPVSVCGSEASMRIF